MKNGFLGPISRTMIALLLLANGVIIYADWNQKRAENRQNSANRVDNSSNSRMHDFAVDEIAGIEESYNNEYKNALRNTIASASQNIDYECYTKCSEYWRWYAKQEQARRRGSLILVR